jgi:lysophospholipase L1-like esterase
MIRFKISLLFIIVISSFQAVMAVAKAKPTDTLYANRLKPYGRSLINDRNQLELISSAVHFGFSFRGNQCELYVSLKDKNAHNYIQYELDGVYQKRIRIEGGSSAPIVIKTATTGYHTVKIFKATEAHTGAVQVSKVVANTVKPLQNTNALLIEFIGNSITCGAAADVSEVPCGTGDYHDQHNAYMAYGPRVARSLGLNYLLSSVSGIGVYRTWNMDGPAMPQVYERIDFQAANAQKWDFKKYKPAIVSIALGTNDLSNGDGKTARRPFNQHVFVNSYVNFIKQVKAKYPRAKIALISSPMISEESSIVLEKCLVLVKGQIDKLYPADKPVHTFLFKPIEAHGCTGHPSVEDHLILAQQLKPFYQAMLK